MKAKHLRAALMTALVVMAFVSIDLGLNFAYSLIPEVNDGIACRGLLHVFGFFGDSGWTRIRFFKAFEKALWVTFALFAANAALLLKKNE